MDGRPQSSSFARNCDTLNTDHQPENKPKSIFLHDNSYNTGRIASVGI